MLQWLRHESSGQSFHFVVVCCYLVWLTWVTVTSTPDTEADTDPAEEYFNHFRDRGIEVSSSIVICKVLSEVFRLTWAPTTLGGSRTTTWTSPGPHPLTHPPPLTSAGGRRL